MYTPTEISLIELLIEELPQYKWAAPFWDMHKHCKPPLWRRLTPRNILWGLNFFFCISALAEMIFGGG
jgi:hypothetical protein